MTHPLPAWLTVALCLLEACSQAGAGQPVEDSGRSAIADDGGRRTDAVVGVSMDGGRADAALHATDAAPGGLDGGGAGAASVDAGDSPSNGGTITFEQIGAAGWYPSRRDPQVGPCDAHDEAGCCMTRHDVASDALTPWNQDLIMTLRGPLQVAKLAVYQPPGDVLDRWALVSSWDAHVPADARGVAFRGNGTESAGFDGAIGSECLIDVSRDEPFACGSGSVPYCPAGAGFQGWAGSKLLVLMARAPHAGAAAPPACSTGSDGNWYDAPWIGLSLGELVRSGAFSSCHCYARDPQQWWLGDGCGQFNVFEVVNDNNGYRNLDVFSTNFFGYAGYVGEGPCGSQCDLARLGAEADLVDKQTSLEAARGGTATPGMGPGVAFRRPAEGYRYFLILLHEPTRTVQLALIHPNRIPSAARGLLPALPAEITASDIDGLLGLRLPR